MWVEGTAMCTVSLDDAQSNLAVLIQRALSGEEVAITQALGTVRLVPVPAAPKRRSPGSATGRVWLSDDFDAPLDDFACYR